MSSDWYYTHDGATHGPFSEKEIKKRAARQMLLESDLVWPAGREQKDAAPANVVFDFAPLPSVVSPIPDWLADVAEVERKGPLPGVLPTDEIPEWLEDLRLWVGLDVYAPGKHTSSEMTGSAPTNPALSGAIPDWLENWTTPERPKAPSQTEAAPVPCDMPAPSSQPTQPAVPLAPPVAKQEFAPAKTEPPVSPPAQPAIVAKQETSPDKAVPPVAPLTQTAIPPVPPIAKQEPSPVQTVPPVSPPTQPAKTVPSTPLLEKADKKFIPKSIAPKPPIVVPAQLPTASSAPAITPATTNSLADKIFQMSGFDMETGQILDADKFRKWKQQQAQIASANQPAVSNASLIEIFRKARTAIETWIDDDANRLCIMQAEIAEIGRKPEIQNILNEYDGYGKEMRDKLLRHLGFMVQNRRKYYQAVEGRLAR